MTVLICVSVVVGAASALAVIYRYCVHKDKKQLPPLPLASNPPAYERTIENRKKKFDYLMRELTKDIDQKIKHAIDQGQLYVFICNLTTNDKGFLDQTCFSLNYRDIYDQYQAFDYLIIKRAVKIFADRGFKIKLSPGISYTSSKIIKVGLTWYKQGDKNEAKSRN